jgi:leucyl/phenylalanyl-tRNA---protein transferase
LTSDVAAFSPELILSAYCRGYFPMAGSDGAIQWYLPKHRAVFLPGDAHTSRGVKRLLRGAHLEVAVDQHFAAVVRACAMRDETWISDDIREAYEVLHRWGFAHSVEVHYDGRLAGGLYGVAIGGAFFGESMFHTEPNASKVAFAVLCRRLDERGFVLHDAQFMTSHLMSLGAREISNAHYQDLLRRAIGLRCSFS